MKECKYCHRMLPLEDFHVDSTRPDGRNRRCKQCAKQRAHQYYLDHRGHILHKTATYQTEHREQSNQYSSQWRKRNRDRTKQWHKEWEERNPDHVRLSGRARQARRRGRIRGNGGTHTTIDLGLIYLQQHGQCYYCHKYLALTAGHFDHLVPIALGGSNDPDNLVFSCPKCNRKKGSSLPE